MHLCACSNNTTYPLKPAEFEKGIVKTSIKIGIRLNIYMNNKYQE